MDPQHDVNVEVAPIYARGSLQGFILVGRWPVDTVEWTQFLWLAVRVAAVPTMLPHGSTVFRVVESVPEDSPLRSVGVVLAEGQLVGDHALQPGRFADEQPAGLAVLHPPTNTIASVREYETASGCLLLPGLPYLGLAHRAAWIEADASGTVTRLSAKDDIDPGDDPDTAALSLLLAS
ncbi:MAG: peptidase [Intrasporangium sp.]|uniref:peptidase n=1 Tax=Intrasporangium sp. TaxID=1925024 RepID=UPI002648612D|nr:peptidase [Intrasporangium sp.]MDN5794906.1 peptidase [Intrasporangium sp.]